MIFGGAIFLIICAIINMPLITYANEASQVKRQEYQVYRDRFEGIQTKEDISDSGFQMIEKHVFPMTLQEEEVFFYPAMDQKYNRLALFLVNGDGKIVYKTDQLETNNRYVGELKQPNKGIAAVAFQDVNKDGLLDIVLITSCVNEAGAYAGNPYKVGDVLFQNRQGFYRDWRISDKINRFSMNISIECITAFLLEGYSTEFLYTATTMAELLKHKFQVIEEQCYWRNFEKLGRLQVVPGTYRIADYDIFMIYLVNSQGNIVWSFQPMGDYDNLYALKGINCRDIDGDGLKDMVVLGRYSYEGKDGEWIIESDYGIYYQRTGGFYADKEFKQQYKCSDEITMEELIQMARAHWGWESKDDKNTDSR